MIRNRRWASLFALLLAFTLLSAACSSDDATDTSVDDSSTPSADETPTTDDSATPDDAMDDMAMDYSSLSGDINASGASFPNNWYQAAIEAWNDTYDLTVVYEKTGSGTGKSQFGEGLTNWAGSDSLVSDELAPEDFFYIPSTAAPITVSYNLPGVEDLHLSPETIAGIFQGDITTWDSPEIAADNPDVELPSTPVIVARRSDGSGTTANFTSYLDKAADNWALGNGDTVEWPSSSQGGEKNTGVAAIIQENEGAVGYVDYSDAKLVGLTFASIKNKAGNFIAPKDDLSGVSAALAGATVADDFTIDVLDADGADAYPIAAPTYILIRSHYDNQETLDNVRGFVTWLLTEGAELAPEIGFAKLPAELRDAALAQFDQVTAG